MPAEIYLARRLGVLYPVDGQGEDYIASLGAGEIVRAVLKKDRNPGHHRKFFGVLRTAFENQSTYLSLEGLRFAVMIAAGYADTVKLDGDKVAFKPQSLNWSRMDQHEFDKFYKAALEAIPRLLPQFEGVDLDKESQ